MRHTFGYSLVACAKKCHWIPGKIKRVERQAIQVRLSCNKCVVREKSQPSGSFSVIGQGPTRYVVTYWKLFKTEWKEAAFKKRKKIHPRCHLSFCSWSVSQISALPLCSSLHPSCVEAQWPDTPNIQYDNSCNVIISFYLHWSLQRDINVLYCSMSFVCLVAGLKTSL